MRLLSRVAVVAVVGSFTTLAFAQESEFQGKIQEDLDSYKGDVVKWCGTTPALTIKYSGKLGSNPRETKKGDYSGVSSLCTAALEGLAYACRNDTVKAKMTKVTAITCQAGKGTMTYNLKSPNLAFSVDSFYSQDNASSQKDIMVDKMKKDLDK